ncbi:hypothetical protein AA0112_g11953 [Alternaria arborescens]|nr:hypothetical protein AA0112_g11953 [Alternaria arborescens]
MKTSWLLFVCAFCTTSYSQGTQEMLGSLDLLGNSYKCENGQSTCFENHAEKAHSVGMATLQSQCDAQEQAHTTRQNELEAQLKTAQQALEAARNNQTAIVEEWMSKPFAWHGCYQDVINKRVLSDVYVLDSSMTSSKCSRICQGHRYYGTEIGKECFCGNTVNGNPARVSSAGCMTACGGNPKEQCGGSLKVNIFTKNL